MPADPPRRLRVVGNSGAGKTTLAREAARRLGVGHLELDAVFWAEHWTMRDVAEAHALLRDFLASPGARDGWVTDGNWNSRRGELLEDADAVVWLDYPRRVVMARVLRRTLRRGALREELWHGNRERLRNLLRREPDENIVLWSWTQHESYRERYAALASSGDVPVIRLRHPREARAWLESLEPGTPGRG
ncbi:toxin [Cellulomonas fimi]|uniref:Shikimate kinase n=1 Tax=Cellulomonas fimi (strain ATCC 484 / DSM 20113 / JCM 1341 / CCUG 24087 / LMG 16345 / NBRC 15513 / NCIMB 8980 / NCTC 7547 / NRS-133) TaxID=590998 RepID=F4H5T3_CELFA|nr:toxin [Cellulomonas fimi]AEE45533.1 shikimate kinase [Cellulomonas fimi ATCC 484]NNH05955.1 toxin [Cellulomonas fimi]VEH29757.1 topology modulation protein [Cellulomonas fimi]